MTGGWDEKMEPRAAGRRPGKVAVASGRAAGEVTASQKVNWRCGPPTQGAFDVRCRWSRGSTLMPNRRKSTDLKHFTFSVMAPSALVPSDCLLSEQRFT